MRLSLDSKFIIYGASTRGKEYYKAITRNGMEVLAFIDKNALKMQNIDDIPVYGLKELDHLQGSKSEVILIISISNVFLHYSIAEKLFSMGFPYIIYKELEDNSIYGKEMNQLYQFISVPCMNMELVGLELPAFKLKQRLEPEEKKAEFVTKPIPVELLFGLSKEFYLAVAEKKNPQMIELVPDKSLLYFTINKDMMHFFSHTVTEREWSDYIRLYFEQRNCMVKEASMDLEEEENHLKDRYFIFQNMEALYYTNINFFYENPAEVEWNPKGYFNIQDGNNRVAFLFAKGWNMIPCRMSYADYEVWLNKSKIKEVEDCVEKIGMVEYPISNPYFANRISKSMPFCYLKLRKLGEWLYKKKIKVEGKNILDVGCKNGFMGQFFARMGANVTAIETDAWYRSLCQLVNELVFAKMEVFSGYNQLQEREYDIVLLPRWGTDDLQQTLGYVKEILIVDAINPEEIFSNHELAERYAGEELCQLFSGNKIIHTIIFTRR